MSLYSLEHLTKSTQWGGMFLTIFDTRYAAAIEDKSSGPYNEWEVIHNPLPTLGWFPIVFVKNIDDAIPAMRAKLKKIEEALAGFAVLSRITDMWIFSIVYEERTHSRILKTRTIFFVIISNLLVTTTWS